jgi:hypothetical protein
MWTRGRNMMLDSISLHYITKAVIVKGEKGEPRALSGRGCENKREKRRNKEGKDEK